MNNESLPGSESDQRGVDDGASYVDALARERDALRGERDGYKNAYEALSSEVGTLRSERDGYKGAYEQLGAEVGTLRSERDGYKGAYEEVSAEIGQLRTERDGYRKAYGAVSEEAGAALALVERYRLLYEAAAAEQFETRPAEAEHRLDPSSKAFLILGNGRTGSTWLLTMADHMDGVVAQKEINWRSSGMPSRPMLTGMDGHSKSIRGVIAAVNGLSGEAVEMAGGKLILDPYGYFGPDVFAHLDKIIEDDVKLVSLRRSYLSTWLSFKARGVFHQLDAKVLAKYRERRDVRYVEGMEPPPVRQLLLTSNGVPLVENADLCDPILYPLRDAVDDMLMAFCNDVQAIALVRSRGGLLLDYSEVSSRFGEFCAYVGLNASQETIDAVMDAPLVQKLETLTADLVQPASILPELSNILGSLATADEPLLDWPARDVVEIASPDLAAFLMRHGIDPSGNGTAPESGGDTVRWRLRKPRYTL
ncbi:MAG: hypothetical protein CL626_00085 [Aurantimonas sp.]|nr:hypothetical protein [Aurantimonas sp.]